QRFPGGVSPAAGWHPRTHQTHQESPMPPKAIDAAAVRALIETNPDTLLVDVRTPAEYESSHIDGAINLPLGQVDRHLERLTQDAGGQMVLICQSGSRAEQCQGKLIRAGLEDTAVMSG